MTKQTLNVSPFPSLQWDDDFWAGEVVLPSWAGFQSRCGAYGPVSSRTDSDGSARLSVAPANDEERTPPSPEQVEAFRFVLEQERAVGSSVLRAIFAACAGLRESYGDDDEAEKLMPEIEQPEQLRHLIGLSSVHVLNVARNGVAYVGFEFGCTWDEEHGLGAMTAWEP
jgi:hypothetical protein